MRIIFLTFLAFLSLNLMSQSPPNDWVCGAIETEPDSCWEGNTFGGDDITPGQGVGADCQSHGNNVEVWYSFIADNTGFNFDVYHDTTINGTTYTASSVDLILFRVSTFSPCDETAPCGDPDACDFDDLVGMACWEDDGTRDLNGVTSGLVVGQRYYFLVSSAVVSGETPGTFLVCFSNTPYVPPGDGCDEATTLCNNNSFTAPGGEYTILQENLDLNSCLGGPYDGAGGVNYNMPSRWYEFTFATSGTFGFDIFPDPTSGDIDFLLFNQALQPCQPIMSTPVACNYSGASGATGMSYTGLTGLNTPNPCGYALANDCTPGGGGAGAGCQPCAYWNGGTTVLNVTAGQTYTLYVGNYDNSSPNGFTVDFQGTAQIGPQAGFIINSTTCGLDSTMNVQVTANIITPGFVYTWEMGDGSYYSGTTVNHTYTYNNLTGNEYAILLTVTDTNTNQTCLAASEALVTCPLPLVFTSTDARIKTDGVELTWTTPIELPTDRFVVQYSSDLSNWFEAGRVYNGVSTNQMRYKYLHNVSINGNAWYRIIHFDESGMQTVSNILSVNSYLQEVRTLVRIVDIYGRDVLTTESGKLYIYQYSDGYFEKRIILK